VCIPVRIILLQACFDCVSLVIQHIEMCFGTVFSLDQIYLFYANYYLFTTGVFLAHELLSHFRCRVFKAVRMVTSYFWGLTPCRFVSRCPCFGETFYLHLNGRSVDAGKWSIITSALCLEAEVCTSETLKFMLAYKKWQKQKNKLSAEGLPTSLISSSAAITQHITFLKQRTEKSFGGPQRPSAFSK
jgi:hypothetical protein